MRIKSQKTIVAIVQDFTSFHLFVYFLLSFFLFIFFFKKKKKRNIDAVKISMLLRIISFLLDACALSLIHTHTHICINMNTQE